MSATLPVSGAVYAYLEMNSLQRGLTQCLLLNDDYYLDQSAQKHKAAYECFERMRSAGALFADDLFRDGGAGTGGCLRIAMTIRRTRARTEALELARKAVQMAPTSPYAHRAYGFLYASLENNDEVRQMDEKGL